MNEKKAVFGILKTRAEAEQVLAELHTARFEMHDVSVLLPNKGPTRDFAYAKGTNAPEGAVAGGTAGGAVGGTLGLLAGLGTLAIPGVGPLLAAGPILAGLGGAAVGAAVGSMTGALVGLGIPEVQAKLYEGKVREGSVLMSVHTIDRPQVDEVKRIFGRHGAVDVGVHDEVAPPMPRRPVQSTTAAR